jgi:type I restriction enzyme S subunit
MQCDKKSRGTSGKNRIRPERFLEIEIPLAPLTEQRHIVARIEELAARIEEARGLRRQAVEEAEALISLEVTRLFSNVEQRGWQVESLENYLVDTRYGTSQKTTDDDTGTPVLRMGNIQQGRLDLRDLKYLHLNDSELSNLHLARGDVLVNRTNSAELVGKCAVFDLEEEYVFASYLIRLRLDRTRVEPKLLSLYLNSPLGRAYMLKEKTQMTGQANVNAKKLRALPIALPSLPEQRRIVAYLDDLQATVDSLKQLQAETAAELDALLPSVLDRAFKGEL